MPTERELAFMCVKYRKDNKITLIQLAKEIGLSVNSINFIENEKKVTKRIFLIVYEFLKEKGVEL